MPAPERCMSASEVSPSSSSNLASPVHAAAINGDKASLHKLIAGNPALRDAMDHFGRTPLMYCVLADRLDCAETLLKAGADVNKADHSCRTALHLAAQKGNYRFMKLLLVRRANWMQKDLEEMTPLHLATKHKSPKCLSLLLKCMAPGEVDTQDKNKQTALHWSAYFNNPEHVKLLIKHDSNIGIPDIEGKIPLHWAANNKDPRATHTVKCILEAAPTESLLNWQDYEGRTPLHFAVADGNEAVVDVLTSYEGCNVTSYDNLFRTPLHWAALLGHAKIVHLLLERNRPGTIPSDSQGATPLHYAAQSNFSETVKVFLEHPTVKDDPDLEGRTAFMWAAGKGSDDVIRVMLSLKPDLDINMADKYGGTALHAAALSGHVSTVQLLRENGAQVDATDVMKHTPLFRACEMGHKEVIQTLIKGEARVDLVDQDGHSPLHWAALGGNADVCQILIENGINPNVQDLAGRTPLQCAAYGGYINCMAVLMENKADPNIQDKEGKTALHWSCNNGYLDAVKLLLGYNAFPNQMESNEERYTPLDYALLGEHHEVIQFMLEHGALSIAAIQDIAAFKIQAIYKGYKVRKAFQERKKLLMKHEQLRKDAAKKKEESKRKEADQQCAKVRSQTPLSSGNHLSQSLSQTGGDRGCKSATLINSDKPLKARPPSNSERRSKSQCQPNSKRVCETLSPVHNEGSPRFPPRPNSERRIETLCQPGNEQHSKSTAGVNERPQKTHSSSIGNLPPKLPSLSQSDRPSKTPGLPKNEQKLKATSPLDDESQVKESLLPEDRLSMAVKSGHVRDSNGMLHGCSKTSEVKKPSLSRLERSHPAPVQNKESKRGKHKSPEYQAVHSDIICPTSSCSASSRSQKVTSHPSLLPERTAHHENIDRKGRETSGPPGYYRSPRSSSEPGSLREGVKGLNMGRHSPAGSSRPGSAKVPANMYCRANEPSASRSPVPRSQTPVLCSARHANTVESEDHSLPRDHSAAALLPWQNSSIELVPLEVRLQVVEKERARKGLFRKKNQAAATIQRSWRRYCLRKQLNDVIARRCTSGPEMAQWNRDMRAFIIKLLWNRQPDVRVLLSPSSSSSIHVKLPNRALSAKTTRPGNYSALQTIYGSSQGRKNKITTNGSLSSGSHSQLLLDLSSLSSVPPLQLLENLGRSKQFSYHMRPRTCDRSRKTNPKE
ncbi:inversin isoform X2 [Polypterus senegalus]|nr:inversin isoform X2 [Polypterus senegalus]